MAKIEPPKPRSVVAQDGDGLRITIPIKRNWIVIGLLLGCVLMWSAFPFIVTHDMNRRGVMGPPEEIFAFMIITLSVFVLIALFLLSWNIGSREIIVVKGTSFITRKELIGLGRSREFDLPQIKNLRYAPQSFTINQFITWPLHILGILGGELAFDYGARTYRFGHAVEEPEAKRLIEAIQKVI